MADNQRTIDEIRAARRQAETIVLNAIREFEKYSQLSVDAIRPTFDRPISTRHTEVVAIALDVRLD